ncbi:alpha/beta fold hydrolase [Streptomyces sp. NPDC047017]|uniref:thioesterase II family protein n=1 Tax=Streptomyces sp. NPDC047017 TaxID=3155024 RepID=UPI003400EC67
MTTDPGSQARLGGPADVWLRRIDRTGMDGGVRLVAFPHAGGGPSAYQAWLPAIPPGVELWAVAYPGREDRSGEPPLTSIEQTAQDIAVALQWISDTPYVLFGHSMGAVVAYETCHALACIGAPRPGHLFVSGSPSPPRAARDAAAGRTEYELHWLKEEPLHDWARAELQDMVRDTIASDLRALAGYRDPSAWRTTTPLSVVYGSDDADLDDEEARRWSDFTAGDFSVTSLPGDHFTCFNRPHDMLQALRNALPG